jgi:oligopeptide/dipeptide ABC transporter ATP-binding protein
LLSVENLRIEFPTRHGTLVAIDDASFHIDAGEILGVVGESGAGRSIIGLVDPPRARPYIPMLLDAIPDLEMSGRARIPVAGEVPDPIDPPSGCTFHPRCPHANQRCRSEAPETITVDGIRLACHGVEEGRIADAARAKA